MVRFTLRQCLYFRTVAEAGGIAQAARLLNISQPAIAQALETLEAATGLTLFERRHARGLTPTLEGRLFLDHVLRLEAQAESTAREAALLSAGRSGEIRLGLFVTLAPFYGPALLRFAAEAAPGLTVLPREMALADLAEALREGTLDLALTYGQGADLAGLHTEWLADLEPRIVIAADHPLAARASVSASALSSEPYVMFEGPGSRGYFEALLAELGIDPPIGYASTSLETVRSAVGNGFGFTLLAMQPNTSESYDGRPLRVLSIEEPVPKLPIVLASRPSRPRSPVLETFTSAALAFFAAAKPDS